MGDALSRGLGSVSKATAVFETNDSIGRIAGLISILVKPVFAVDGLALSAAM